MTEWISSSSVLITAVLILRRVLRGKLSPSIQYALWAIVLIRLLMPFSLFSSNLSIHNVQEQVSKRPEVQQIQQVIQAPIRPQTPTQNTPQTQPKPQQSQQHGTQAQVPQQSPTVDEPTEAVSATSLADLAAGLWIAGIAVMGLWLAWCNIRFSGRLKRTRQEMECPQSLLPVYFSPVVETPCLFGLFHPAVYLTGDAVEDATVLRYVLTHELTHYRQMDHLWSVLRAAALILHWYNPLVWIAFRASRQDCEMACDARTLRVLGDEHRGNYGRTLVGLATGTRFRGTLVTATSMGSSKRAMKERIVILMKNPKTAMMTLVSLILVCALIVGCTFTGPSKPEEPTDPILQFETLGELFTDRFNGTYEYTPDDRSGDAYQYIVTELDSGISYHPLPDDGLFNFSESALLLDWENAVSGVNGFWDDSDIMVQIGQPDGSFYIQFHNGTNANWIYISECDKYVPLTWDSEFTPAEPINEILEEDYDYYLLSGRHIDHYGNGDPEATVTLFLDSIRQCYLEARNRSLSGQFDYADVDISGVDWIENEDGSLTVSADIWLRPRTGQKTVYPGISTWEEDGSVWMILYSDLIRLEDGNWYLDSNRDGVPNWEPEIIPTEPEETHEPQNTIPKEGIPLTREQIIQVNTAFVSLIQDEYGGMGVSPISNFFSSFYRDPTDIELDEFLRHFSGEGIVEDWYGIVTEEEYDDIRVLEGFPFPNATDLDKLMVPINKYPASAVSQVLYHYTGYNLMDLKNANGFGNAFYSEKYDSFYTFVGDLVVDTFTCTGGRIYDGAVELYSGEGNILYLVERNGRYCIESYYPDPAVVPLQLSSEEIDRWNEILASTVMRADGVEVPSPVSNFFTCFYDTPEEIDLNAFLKYFNTIGFRDQVKEPVTEEEFNALIWLEDFPYPEVREGAELYASFWKHTSDEIDQILSYYAGVSVASLRDSGSDGPMLYLEEYDAYYVFQNSTEPGSFTVISGWDYDSYITLNSAEGTTLMLIKDSMSPIGYYIKSHLPR